MAHMSEALEMCEHALKTREPSCIIRLAMSFFIREARGR
jgi:hypothetical protein